MSIYDSGGSFDSLDHTRVPGDCENEFVLNYRTCDCIKFVKENIKVKRIKPVN